MEYIDRRNICNCDCLTKEKLCQLTSYCGIKYEFFKDKTQVLVTKTSLFFLINLIFINLAKCVF